jgi:hypothetical protein
MALADVLSPVIGVQVEDDGALTLRHDGTFASLRTMQVAEGLELISLSQLLAWDLPLNAELRERVAAQANSAMFGTIALTERPGDVADVMLRYNFPASGLDEQALQTLVLMVLAGGAEARRALTQP